MYKPKLRYSGISKQWMCYGKDILRFAQTPNQAYIKWRLENDRQKFMETKVHGLYSSKTFYDLHWEPNDWYSADSKV